MRIPVAIMALTVILLSSRGICSAFGASEETQLSPEGMQKIEIIVDSYTFRPDHIVVSANKRVELTLRSITSLIPHNFTVNHPEAGLDIDQDIPHGQDVKVTFTPTKLGRYEFYCDKKFLFDSHREKGMIGVLEVR